MNVSWFVGAGRVAVVFGLVVTLSACNQMTKKDGGALVGGALGGLVGSTIGRGDGRIAAAVAGALLGAYVGSSVGESMDELDRRRASDALETSPTGSAVAWTNPDSGSRYRVTPTRTYYERSQTPCREFTTEAWIEGKRETVRGSACRQQDGSWRSQ
jgi:surface antigen